MRCENRPRLSLDAHREVIRIMARATFCMSTLATVCLVLALASGQSVVQQCLSEQIRSNLDNTQGQHNVTPEATMLAAFESICRNYEKYMSCFQDHLQPSDHPEDTFLRLIFSQIDMHRAYKGLCTLDLEALRPNIRCLLSTPQVRSCYNNFNHGINKVVHLERQQQLEPATVRELACNVSVTRYRCETDVYAFCDSKTGQIMQDFFFAGIPETCRTMSGVMSRYVAIFNGGAVPGGSKLLTVVTLAFLFLSRAGAPFGLNSGRL